MYKDRRPITFKYSNESERANEDIYDDFELKKKIGLLAHTKKMPCFKVEVQIASIYMFQIVYIIIFCSLISETHV